jgi:hypothetical protein
LDHDQLFDFSAATTSSSNTDSLFWPSAAAATTTTASFESGSHLATAPPLDSFAWSSAPLPSGEQRLDFDFNTLPQPTFSDLDLQQFMQPESVSPSTTSEDRSDVNTISSFTLTPALAGSPLTLPSPHASGSLVPGLSSASRHRSSPPSPDHQDVLLKRHRNNIAAKKYRQKKVDRIKELEDEVSEVKRERDELRIKLARQEAETAALREMLAGRIGRSANVLDR